MDYEITDVGNNGKLYIWGLTNTIGSGGGQTNDIIISLAGVGYFIIEEVGGNSDTTSTFNEDTQYWIEIERDESVGTYGTLYGRLYTDSSRTTLSDSGSIALGAKRDYRYIYALAGFDDNQGGRDITGYVQNLDLQESVEDTTPPTYSNQGTNNTQVSLATKFHILYNDNTALESNGGYIFSTNNTGTWVNESYVSWTSTPEWANITKVLNDTVGNYIGYRWYANDSAGNTNHSIIYYLTTTSTPTQCWTQGTDYVYIPNGCNYYSEGELYV